MAQEKARRPAHPVRARKAEMRGTHMLGLILLVFAFACSCCAYLIFGNAAPLLR
jgi:hypothetical protein